MKRFDIAEYESTIQGIKGSHSVDVLLKTINEFCEMANMYTVTPGSLVDRLW